MVCRLREGLLEGVRSPLKGRGKGVHLRQEAGMWAARRSQRPGSLRNPERCRQAAAWRKWDKGAPAGSRGRGGGSQPWTPVRSLDFCPKGRGAFEG